MTVQELIDILEEAKRKDPNMAEAEVRYWNPEDLDEEGEDIDYVTIEDDPEGSKFIYLK